MRSAANTCIVRAGMMSRRVSPLEPEESVPEGTKVVTEHVEAAKAIDALRNIAKVLKAVGDENVQLKEGNERVAALESEAETLRTKNAELSQEAEESTGLIVDWRDLLEDFRRGLVDSDELLERTVGRA